MEPYSQYLQNVEQFCRLNALPVDVQFGNSRTAECFVTNRAKWHKSCHDKFNTWKLERTKKRRHSADTADNEDSTTRKRLSRGDAAVTPETCIFCSLPGELIPYRSYDADAKLRTMAKELNDTALIAKLSAGGDVIALDAHYHFDCLKSLRNKYR